MDTYLPDKTVGQVMVNGALVPVPVEPPHITLPVVRGGLVAEGVIDPTRTSMLATDAAQAR